MKSLLCHAQNNKYAVGYFEAFNMDAMFAVIDAAENRRSPVIIGFGGQFISSPKRIKKDNVFCYGALAKEAALQTDVPVAVLLNEADNEDMIYQGMNAGFNAVMYKKPDEDIEQTIKITKEICQVSHTLGIDVESEVGELPCADISSGNYIKGENTDVKLAKRFVDETGVDALAIAIGNVHILEEKKASIDYDLLAKLRNELAVPLVLHGGTGLSEEDLHKVILSGISKINIGTALKRAFIETIGDFYKKRNVNVIDPHITIGWGGCEDMIDCGRTAITRKTEMFMDLFGSSGHADKIRGEKNK